jgi:hypothetical protein
MDVLRGVSRRIVVELLGRPAPSRPDREPEPPPQRKGLARETPPALRR